MGAKKGFAAVATLRRPSTRPTRRSTRMARRILTTLAGWPGMVEERRAVRTMTASRMFHSSWRKAKL